MLVHNTCSLIPSPLICLKDTDGHGSRYNYMHTVYPIEYEQGFVVFCFVGIIYNEISPCDTFTHILHASFPSHYSGVITRAMASQITGVSMICSTVFSGLD